MAADEVPLSTGPSRNDPSAPPPSQVNAESLRGFRAQLTKGKDAVDPATWAGSLSPEPGIAPRVRVGRSRWFNLLWLLPIGFVLLIVGVALAKELRGLSAVQSFIADYPGTVPPPNGQVGISTWVGWQHFFNLFLFTFIIRSGIQILADHPRLYWTRHSTPIKQWFRFQKAVPDDSLWTSKQDSVTLPGQVGLPGIRHSIGLARWWHLGITTLWLLNGVIFYVLIFATGHWQRLVPTSWDFLPHAVSVAIQYLSLDWPVETGWVAYNSLQVLGYFVTVFIAGPLTILTGLGMSPALSTRFTRISSVLSIQTARSLHFLVTVYFIVFIVFIVLHVALVFATVMRENLNHMYAGRNDDSWVGFWVFAASMVIVIVGWVAATPFTLRHPRAVQRIGYALIGPLQRLFEHVDARPGQYTEKDISPYFWHNGKYPETDEYKALHDSNFVDYRLQIGGLVDHPVELDLTQLRALQHHEQITQHFCIQGWSGVAKWGGVSMQTIVELVKPKPEVQWVVFYSLADGPDGEIYYDAHPLAQMSYHLTMLAYDMNGEALSYGHGAPLRLRNEVQLGFKMVKWLKGIEFVEDFSGGGGGYGGYNQDHEFFGYRQGI